MKIRTITTGVNLAYPIEDLKIKKVGEFEQIAKNIFEEEGYEVQDLRMSTQPWPEYLGELKTEEVLEEISELNKRCEKYGINFFSIGTVSNPEDIDLIPEIIKLSPKISASSTIADLKNGINYESARKAAETIIRLSKETEKGYGNFSFAAISNCPPDIPFFPASYHKRKRCFSIGLECSDLVYKAFENSKNIRGAEKELRIIFEHKLKKVEKIAKNIEKREGISFHGIDVSTAPSLKENESLAFAFEKLGLGKFDAPGTLAISGIVTKVLKSLNVKKCGYSGLMLPVLEDFGLAQRCGEGLFDVDNLLLYSAVCGTGLDCVPLPGDIPEDRIYAILLDMATLSLRLNKPLSARLFPVPDKKAGEMTSFKSPYLVDCRIMSC